MKMHSKEKENLKKHKKEEKVQRNIDKVRNGLQGTLSEMQLGMEK